MAHRPNLPDNIIQASNGLNQQCESLKVNLLLPQNIVKKIKRLKNQGYIEKVDPEVTPISGQVWYLSHFSMHPAKFE